MELNGTELSTADLALGLALVGIAVVALKWGLARYQAMNADGKITLDEVLDVADDAVDEVRAAATAVTKALEDFKAAKAKEAADKAAAEAEALAVAEAAAAEAAALAEAETTEAETTE